MIRVAIIDSHWMARAGLRIFLSRRTDLRVVAEGADSAAALEVARNGSADVVVLCLSCRWKMESTLVAMRTVSASLPVLVLWPSVEESPARGMLEKGAHCIMDKACSADEIAEGIHAVHHRRRCRGAVCLQLAALSQPPSAPRHGALSEREQQVFLRLARGATVGEIAIEMAISLKTVSTFRTRLLKKMGMGSNSDLTRYAVSNGLFDHLLASHGRSDRGRRLSGPPPNRPET